MCWNVLTGIVIVVEIVDVICRRRELEIEDGSSVGSLTLASQTRQTDQLPSVIPQGLS
jgi:hypothetical protein